MTNEEMMSKRELTRKLGLTFDEIDNLLSVETLTSMLMEKLVGGKADATYDGCNDPSCVHGVCSHYDCSHGTCSDDNCEDSPKPTQKPTQKPSPKPTPKSFFI